MIERTHPSMKLMEAMEGLFASGADEHNNEGELLELLNGVQWPLIIHAITHNLTVLYTYTVDGPMAYRGNKLLCDCDKAFRLYQQTQPAQTVDGVTYQRSMELWVSEEMELFVTSCFRSRSGETVTEYRDWKSEDWLSTELEIDFSTLAANLNALCELAASGKIPFYEVSCV